MLEAFLLDDNLAELRSWITNLGITDTVLIEECLQLVLVSIAYLDDNTWVLCEESLDDVGICNVVEVDLHTTLYVGECHLKESCNQTTGTDIVTSHYPTAVDELLYGVEAVNEVLWVLYGRNITAHLAQALSESRTTETLLVETEVDMVEARVLVVNENWANHLLDI